MLKIQFDRLVADGVDELGALVMVIDEFPSEERYQPTIELLEEIGYQRSDSSNLSDGEYAIKTPGGNGTEDAIRTFFCMFKMGRYLIQYQPLNRFLLRGKNCSPHRPESDFRFADWYPVKRSSSPQEKTATIEDQLADDFPNAAMAAQFLHDHGFARSNTHKRLPKNTYFVACRHGDGQPSGIVFRGQVKIYFFDYYDDKRYEIGSSGLLKEHCPTKRQLSDSMSLAANQLHIPGPFDQ
jgi:hypothetical protein